MMNIKEATSVPRSLQEEFERQAKVAYGEEGEGRALAEAIELWLHQRKARLIEEERALNNRAYEAMQTELERDHWGKCVVIAYGRFQGAGDTFDEVKHLAPDAHHRLIFRVGDTPPQERRLGWRIQRSAYAGPAPITT